jgi:hypothetical protein
MLISMLVIKSEINISSMVLHSEHRIVLWIVIGGIFAKATG